MKWYTSRFYYSHFSHIHTKPTLCSRLTYLLIFSAYKLSREKVSLKLDIKQAGYVCLHACICSTYLYFGYIIFLKGGWKSLWLLFNASFYSLYCTFLKKPLQFAFKGLQNTIKQTCISRASVWRKLPLLCINGVVNKLEWVSWCLVNIYYFYKWL